jgi:CYTH domain-containing protein
MREIERKFLVHSLPPLKGIPCYEIEQGYLATELGRSEVRLRRSRDQLLLTVKRDRDDAEGSHSRDEINVILTQEQWDTLWPATSGRRVTKKRYVVPYGDRAVEIDVFRAGNEGIITAEVEFPDAELAQEFVPPEWLGEEITSRPEYSNWMLAK